MWYRFKNFKSNPVTPEELFVYTKDVLKSSQYSLLAIFNNMVMGLWSSKEIDRFSKLRQKKP